MTNQEIHDAQWGVAGIPDRLSIYTFLANNGVAPDKIDDMVDEYFEWVDMKEGEMVVEVLQIKKG
jgi:hypothetical protein